MKIKLTKDGTNISAALIDGAGVESEFNYVSMIKMLYQERVITDTEFYGEFQDDEKESVSAMVTRMASLITGDG